MTTPDFHAPTDIPPPREAADDAPERQERPKATDFLDMISSYPRDAALEAIQQMIDNGVQVTEPRVRHAMRAHAIRQLLIKAGIPPKEIVQVSPTRDFKGMVRLTFDQVEKIRNAQ